MVEVSQVGGEEIFVGVGGVVDGNGVGVGEDQFFERTEDDAQGGAVGFDVVAGEEKVLDMEPKACVINVTEGEGQGAKTIITCVALSMTGMGSLTELQKEGFEENGDAEGCKQGAKGAALGKAFFLKKEAHVTSGVKEPASIVLATK